MYELTVDSSFSAAHLLEGYNGDCARMHGHTWKVSLTVGAITMDEIGLCIDFKDIARILDEIVDNFDHRILNEIDVLDGCNPTAENLSRIIYDLCVKKMRNSDIEVLSVTVAESERYRVTYRK